MCIGHRGVQGLRMGMRREDAGACAGERRGLRRVQTQGMRRDAHEREGEKERSREGERKQEGEGGDIGGRIHHLTSGWVVDSLAFGKNKRTFTSHNHGSIKNPPINSVQIN